MEQEQETTELQTEVPPEAPEAPPEIAPEITQKALDTGWQPEEQFKGDKSRWRPADKWVERGETLIPIIKAQNKNLYSEVNTLKATLEAQKQTTAKLLKMSEKTQEVAYDRARKEIEDKQFTAVQEGDVETWRQLKDEENKLEKPEPIVQEQTSDETPGFNEWHTKNEWYKSDTDLTIFADAYGYNYKDMNKDATPQDVFDAVEKKVKEVFPQKFENANRSIPSAVDTGTIGAGAEPTGDTYADLPADAKVMCNQNVKDGLIKSKEDWVKSYFEEE
jgi:hypothetical protein